MYELCVVVGEVRIVRPDQVKTADMRYKHPRDARAEIALFGVSRRIRSESLELYLSTNHFVIPAAEMSYYESHKDPVLRYIPGYTDVVHHKHLRSISFSLDCRDFIELVMAAGAIDLHTDYRPHSQAPERVASGGYSRFHCTEAVLSLRQNIVEHSISFYAPPQSPGQFAERSMLFWVPSDGCNPVRKFGTTHRP